ncbi:MAG: hypothetical protein OHK0022_49510 [Roseiflexaceae bacterium]
MITDLIEQAAALPADLAQAFARIFAVDRAVGRLELPETMEAWAERQFGGLEVVREQTVVTVLNRLTLEAALFNPLRARRPGGPASDDAELERWVAAELAQDIFADPLRDTSVDLFGRVRGRYAVSAANVAKCAALHGLVIFDEPHPLRFTRHQLRDYLDVAQRWITEAHRYDQQAIHPVIFWNCMPKSGATIMHGHMQMALARLPFARVEQWRRAASLYHAENGRRYLDDMAGLHRELGLGLPAAPGVRAFAHLTPLRNREIVALAEPSPRLDPLADTLYNLLRTLIEWQGVRSFNLLVALPPLHAGPDEQGWPVIARLADRGAALTHRGDLGAIELFGSGCITIDPFDLAVQLQSKSANCTVQ